MITVDKERCTGCGTCAIICHEQCIAIVQDAGGRAAAVNHAHCSTCTQCVAICPSQALGWGRVRATAYDNACLPSPEQLQELLKQRRTVRRFSKRKLHRRLIAEIAGYAAYAPTNNYHLRLVTIDDPALLETLYAVARKVTARLYNLYFRSDVVFSVLSTMTPKVDVKTRIKLARAVAEGEALEQPPAAMVFVVGDRRVLLSEASAQYALYNIILYALTKGIGSRINAAGQVVFDRNRKIRRQLGLERQEHVLGAVELGYSGVRFRNKVDGKALPLQWNGAMELQGKNTEAQQRLSSQKGVG